jgi:DNA polymerase III delta prime subunit
MKVVILDEADYLNPNSTQPALRGFIEEFSGNCRFIFTANFKNRIIEPLHSRCANFEFNIPKTEKPAIAKQLMQRIMEILKTESVEFEPKVIAEVINRHFPDFRRILNELQNYSSSGKIDSGILVNLSEENTKSLINYLKAKDFKSMRKWVVDNMDMESSAIFRKIYDSMYQYIQPHSIAQLVLIIGEYQMNDAFVADKEINIVAFFCEIMAEVEFK